MKKIYIFLAFTLVLALAFLAVSVQQISAEENYKVQASSLASNNSEDDDNKTSEQTKNQTKKQNKSQEKENPEVIVNKTRGVKQASFTPWQKRNESECPDGCKCNGAIVSCPTENGKIMTITAGRSGNVITITVNKVEANTSLEIEQEVNDSNKTKIRAKLSDGNKREIKVMPDTANEKALERLRLKVCNPENNCTLQLKEVGKKLKYELQVKRHSRILGIFKKKMQIRAEIDAETGETSVKKPWWAFLASEQSQ